MKKKVLLSLTSVLKTALVACLVYGFVWSLVQWAEHRVMLASIRPSIEADASGCLLFPASAASLHGAEIRFNTYDGVENIGWWDDQSQWISWALDVQQAGAYEVELRYASQTARKTDLEIAAEKDTLVSTAPGTGGWNKWETTSLGTIRLTAGEGKTLTLKAVNLPSKGVINFVHMKLTPVQ